MRDVTDQAGELARVMDLLTRQVEIAAALTQARREAFLEAERAMAEQYLDVIFDGPPGPEAGRFVECEDTSGKSINAGEWIPCDKGEWVLRHMYPTDAIAARRREVCGEEK